MSDIYNKMETYLQGALSGKDKKEFEESLRRDENLTSEFEIYQKARKSKNLALFDYQVHGD